MWRTVHSSATSTLSHTAKGNGKLAWISHLLEGFCISKWCKNHSITWYDLSSIREIFNGLLCWQSSGSRRGHRHSLRGSITKRSNGCPLIRVTYHISCALLPWDSSVTPPDLSLHTLRTYHHRNKSLLMWYAKEMELWELLTHISGFTPMPFVDTVLFCFAFLRQAPAWKADLWLCRFAGPNTIFS